MSDEYCIFFAPIKILFENSINILTSFPPLAKLIIAMSEGYGRTVRTLQRRAVYATAILYLFIAAAGATISAGRTEQKLHNRLISQTAHLAGALSTKETLELTFTQDDLSRPQYHRISRQLRAYCRQAGYNAICLHKLRDGHLVCGPSSLPEDHPLHNPPGTICPEASAPDQQTLQTGKPSIFGPQRTGFGLSARASSPILHPGTGERIMILSINTDASVWKRRIFIARCIPALTILTPLIALGIWHLVQRKTTIGTLSPYHSEGLLSGIISMLLAAGITGAVWQMETDSRKDAFEVLALRQTAALQHMFQTLEDDLTLLGGLFEASEHITYNEFNQFSQLILNDVAIRNAAWARSISTEETETFEHEARTQTGIPGYTIRSHTGPTANPAAPSTRTPILYINPPADRHILDFDFTSEPVRRQLTEEAERTGLPVASEPLQLGQDPAAPPALIVAKPVQSGDGPGLVLLTMNPRQCIELINAGSLDRQHYSHVEIHELHPDAPPVFIASNIDSDCRPINSRHLPSLTAPLLAFGNCYTIHITPTPHWLHTVPLRNTWTTALGGLLFSIVLAWLIAVIAERPAQLEKLVLERTNELHRSDALFRTLINNIPDLVWLKDPDGVYLLCNRRFEAFFGAGESDIIGKTDHDFVNPELAELFRKNDQEAIDKKSPSMNEERITFASDGHSELLETIKTPLFENGDRLIGVLGIGRDITDREQTQNDLQKSIDELKRFNQAAVGRELRMIELKQDINRLSKELNRAAPYPLKSTP